MTSTALTPIGVIDDAAEPAMKQVLRHHRAACLAHRDGTTASNEKRK
jgi:hypothetical protein